MQDLSFFFLPVGEGAAALLESPHPDSIAAHIDAHHGAFPDLHPADLVIFTLQDLDQPAQEVYLDGFRQQFYDLCPLPQHRLRIADLGCLKPKNDVAEAADQVAYVCEILYKMGKTVVAVGHNGPLVYGQYAGFGGLEMLIEYVGIDSRLDLDFTVDELAAGNTTHKILAHQPFVLKQLSFLGLQRFLLRDTELNILKELNYEWLRFGELSANLRKAEPYLRTASYVSFDLAAVRKADTGSLVSSPAGFSTEQACNLARYAGLGFGLQSMALVGVENETTAELAALVLWHIVEGVAHRNDEEPPKADRSNVECYRVQLTGAIKELVFYRSPETDRWWMEVEALSNKPGHGYRELLACGPEDYETACHGDIPERWWAAQRRM